MRWTFSLARVVCQQIQSLKMPALARYQLAKAHRQRLRLACYLQPLRLCSRRESKRNYIFHRCRQGPWDTRTAIVPFKTKSIQLVKELKSPVNVRHMSCHTVAFDRSPLPVFVTVVVELVHVGATRSRDNQAWVSTIHKGVAQGRVLTVSLGRT